MSLSSVLYVREPSAFQDIPSFSQSNSTLRSDGFNVSVTVLRLAVLLLLLLPTALTRSTPAALGLGVPVV